MKKAILFLFGIVVSANLAVGQIGDPSSLMNTEGSTLEKRCYDADNNLKCILKMRIAEASEYPDAETIKVAYQIQNAQGEMKGQGTVEAHYEDDEFYLTLKDHSSSPSVLQYVSLATMFDGNLLDQASGAAAPWNYFSSDDMGSASFTIRSAKDKKSLARIRIFNRDYVKDEEIATPAGRFEASKIKFTVELDDNGQRTVFHGMEWYAPGTGIVKSEIYDTNKHLQDYTVLTSYHKQ